MELKVVAVVYGIMADNTVKELKAVDVPVGTDPNVFLNAVAGDVTTRSNIQFFPSIKKVHITLERRLDVKLD